MDVKQIDSGGLGQQKPVTAVHVFVTMLGSVHDTDRPSHECVNYCARCEATSRVECITTTLSELSLVLRAVKI